jgi:hypothetical protein
MIDYIHMTALVAVCFVNRQAVIVLLFMLLAEPLFYFSEKDFQFNIYASILYALNAIVFIKFSYEIRQALICTAMLYWLCAVDAFLHPYETLLYQLMPWVLAVIDCYILCKLLNIGGRQIVRFLRELPENFIFSLRYRILWLSSFYR